MEEPGHEQVPADTLGAALFACAAWAFFAVTSYPIIEIADGLGGGARERVGDAEAMLGFSLAAALLATRIIPWSVLRIALILVLLAFLAAHSFESSTTSHAARWPLMAILGLAVVAEWVEVRRPLSQRLHLLWFLWVALWLPEKDHIEDSHTEEIPPLKPLWLLCVAVLVPLLLVLSDWQGRIYLGQMATKIGQRPDEREQIRTSISLFDSTASKATSRQAGLCAVGDKDGNLKVEPLNGGPYFYLPATQPDQMLQILTFSPDGQVLAVADNNRMFYGSFITVWAVAPGNQTSPPSVVLRQTLRRHSDWTLSLDFFPDNRTLISANGDKTVSLWDVTTGEELASFVPHHHKGYWDTVADCVAAAPDGQSFVTWETMDGIKVWDRQSLQLLRQMDARGGIPCSLAFTPDGSRLIAADRASVCKWELHPSPLPFLTLLTLLVALVSWLFWQSSPFRRMPVVAIGGVQSCK